MLIVLFLASRAVCTTMRQREWGRSGNTCSIAGKTGGHTTGMTYSTTKGALQSFTYALANRIAEDDITVNAIATAYMRRHNIEAYPKHMIKRLLDEIRFRHFYEPEAFTRTSKRYISPLSGFICGEIIDQNEIS